MTLQKHSCIGAGCVFCLNAPRPVKFHYVATWDAAGVKDTELQIPTVFRTYDAAVDALAAKLNLGRSRRGRLCAQGFLALQAGAHCDIKVCSCTHPWKHERGMSEKDWRLR